MVPASSGIALAPVGVGRVPATRREIPVGTAERRSGVALSPRDVTPPLHHVSRSEHDVCVADIPPSGAPQPILSLEAVLSAIASPTRWAILRELATGDQLMVVELSDRLGATAAGMSKQMAVLRESGVVIVGRNRLYEIDPRFIADKQERILDFGWCLLRLNARQ